MLLRPLTFALCYVTFVEAAVYPLAKSLSGSAFFDGWNWIERPDNGTHGNVTFSSFDYVTQHGMASVNAQGQVYLGIDNSTYVPQGGTRNSFRIESKDQYGVGTVVVFDSNHLPFGCGTWASFWMTGRNWPNNGELDIFEAVNLQAANTFSLHTASNSNCAVPNDTVQLFNHFTNCSTIAKLQPAGCAIQVPTELPSFGPAFSSQNGGVYAAELAANGIFMYFWPRSDVPANLAGDPQSIDTSSWGTPTANFTPSCDIPSYFGYQRTAMYITMCGDFAGDPNIYNRTCADVAGGICYNNVWGDGKNLNESYFSINSVKWFSQNISVAPTASATPGPSATASRSGVERLTWGKQALPLSVCAVGALAVMK